MRAIRAISIGVIVGVLMTMSGLSWFTMEGFIIGMLLIISFNVLFNKNEE